MVEVLLIGSVIPLAIAELCSDDLVRWNVLEPTGFPLPQARDCVLGVDDSFDRFPLTMYDLVDVFFTTFQTD